MFNRTTECKLIKNVFHISYYICQTLGKTIHIFSVPVETGAVHVLYGRICHNDCCIFLLWTDRRHAMAVLRWSAV